MTRLVAILIAVACISAACDDASTTPAESFPVIPAHLPPVVSPGDNPTTQQRAELGRHLFYDARLSSDGTIACASCHRQEAFFSDAGKQVSLGVGGATGQRNSPMIVNSAYARVQFWDGRAATLEEQHMAAFLNPGEMDADTFAVANLLRTPEYRPMWVEAFGDTLVTMTRAMQAIAAFVRTLVSADSRYDRYVRGDATALSAQELHGMRLFFSSRTNCSSCHGGPNFTDDQFHNIGLFFHYFDLGRYEVTGDPLDEAKFKTPTLRNVALTPPYMAGGEDQFNELVTLEQVVEHYDRGGTAFPTKDPRVRKLGLGVDEKAALVAFMKALTDSSVLRNPRFSRP